MAYGINAETPRRTLKMGDVPVSVPAPFKSGDTLDDNMANALNQTFAENIRNNIARRAKAAEEAEEPFDLQAEIDAYAEEYEFGSTGGGGRIVDPVEKRAMQIVLDKLKAAIRNSGGDLNEYKTSELNAKAREVLEQNPAVREEAQRQIDSERGLAELQISL